MEKLIKKDKEGMLNVSLSLILTLALVFSIFCAPGTIAFAEDEKDTQVQLAEEVTSEEESGMSEEKTPESDVSEESNDGPVNKEEPGVQENETAEAMLLGGAGAVSPFDYTPSGTYLGEGVTGGDNPIRYALYSDFTAVAIGFDYASKPNPSIAWLFNPALDPSGKVVFDAASSNGHAGAYEIKAIADDFNLNTSDGTRTRCSSVTVPNSVVSIGKEAFKSAKTRNLSIDQTNSKLEEIGSHAFYECDLHNNALIGFVIAFPSTLKGVGDYAFYEQVNIQFDLNFGSGLTHVGSFAFTYAKVSSTNPTITLPYGLKHIGQSAFAQISGVTGTIDVPPTVTYIGDEAFYGLHDVTGFTHQKLANVTVNFPKVPGKEVYLDNNFDGIVTKNDGTAAFGKSASWANGDLTEAEITIDYGEQLAANNKLDIVFALDYSGSMTWSADINSGGVDYTYPRIFLMEDIMDDAITELVGAKAKGYDIRLGLTGFSSDSALSTNWSSGSLTDDAATLKANFANNPNAFGGTRYNMGIDAAYDMLNNRSAAEKADRQAVVILLSDGVPNAGFEGLDQAQKLRDSNISLFPMGIYINDLDKVNSPEASTPEEAEKALKAVSYDKQTAFVANTTGEFEKIMQDVIIRSVTTLSTTVEDTMSEFFVVGDIKSITVSAGTATVDGDKFIWALSGADKGKVHRATIRVLLKDKYHGQTDLDVILPTNSDLVTVDEKKTPILEATEQPELYRGVVRYVFESGTNGMALPNDINIYLPSAKKGYTKGTVVSPLSPSSLEYVDTTNVGTWRFVSWDRSTVTAGSKDVTFTGEWVFLSGLADYTVNHHLEDLSGNYVLTDTETISAPKNSQVSALANDYEYYSPNASHPGWLASGTVDPAGTLVLNLYYDLHTYQIKYRCALYTSGDLPIDPNIYKVGESLTVSDCGTMAKEGHTFSRWQTLDASYTYQAGDTLSHASKANPSAGPALEDYSGSAPHYTVYVYASWTPQDSTDPGATPTPGKTTPVKDSLMPKTGDNPSAMIAFTFAALASIVFMALALRKRRIRRR